MFLVTVLVLIVQLNPTILCVGYSYSYLADNCSMCVLDIGLSFYSNFTPFIHVFLG